MTKAQEIKSLRDFADSLPDDSYLKPWVTQVIPEIERDITSDFMPSVSLTQCRREAEYAAEGIILEAKVKAERILKDAEAEQKRVKNELANAQARFLHGLREAAYKMEVAA